jgi:hypothetical protein
MAPTFTTYFLDTAVRKTIGEAYTGWGLDFVWPFLLNFPRNKVAIVDAVCVQHAEPMEGDGRQRVYFANMPRNAYVFSPANNSSFVLYFLTKITENLLKFYTFFQFFICRYQEKDYLLEKFNYNEESLAKFDMAVWEPRTFGMLPLGSKPINPPPDLEPDKKSTSQQLSRAFNLHIGGLGVEGVGEGAPSLQMISLVIGVLILIAILFGMIRTMNRWRRSHVS